MPDATIQAKVRMRAGGDELDVAPGGKITNDGTQAAHIADVATAGSATAAGNATAINAILAALEGVGILASS
jgi:hypothetical protein